MGGFCKCLEIDEPNDIFYETANAFKSTLKKATVIINIIAALVNCGTFCPLRYWFKNDA